MVIILACRLEKRERSSRKVDLEGIFEDSDESIDYPGSHHWKTVGRQAV